MNGRYQSTKYIGTQARQAETNQQISTAERSLDSQHLPRAHPPLHGDILGSRWKSSGPFYIIAVAAKIKKSSDRFADYELVDTEIQSPEHLPLVPLVYLRSMGVPSTAWCHSLKWSQPSKI